MDETLEVRPLPDRTQPPRQTVPPPRKRRRWLTPVIALLVLGGTGYVAWRLLEGHNKPAPASRAGGAPQSVGVATIGTGDLNVVMTGLGAVTPLATVTVVTQINGQLTQVAFTEGQVVHKGDFLAQIDPRPYEVALEQAQGTLARDTGLLNQARADNARYQTLGKQDSIAKQTVQDQTYLIKQDEGLVMTDQGAVDSAKLNLVYCHITSPIDGRVGIRLVDPGNYVQTSNTSGLFVLTQEQPMSVIFTLPEDDVNEIHAQMKTGPLPVTAYDRTNTKLIATGTLATTDNEVDPTTGTIKLRGLFPNTDEALFPQQFVNARLLVRTVKGAVVAPQAAVQQGAPGSFVYLVKPNNTVGIQVVKTGITDGDRVEITDGLKAGDQVVTDGLDRLRDGARISVVQPAAAGAQPAAGAPTAGAPADGEPRSGRRRGNRQNGEIPAPANGAPASSSGG